MVNWSVNWTVRELANIVTVSVNGKKGVQTYWSASKCLTKLLLLKSFGVFVRYYVSQTISWSANHLVWMLVSQSINCLNCQLLNEQFNGQSVVQLYSCKRGKSLCWLIVQFATESFFLLALWSLYQSVRLSVG